MKRQSRLASATPLVVTSWLALTLLAVACDSAPRKLQIRTFSEHFEYRITSDPMPPRAREDVIYHVTVIDKETGQPVEGGEGRIFANNETGTSTWDSFMPAPEVGTYTAKLRFVTAEQWAVGIEFRRDTLPGTKIERATDWQQEVSGASSGP
ncbi:MAG TPA: hypothetical protein VHM30_14330 [Gemmatimonadaceae bacterium]|nr:hypothetical protein [Gemmatimonadaceae bacterium]